MENQNVATVKIDSCDSAIVALLVQSSGLREEEVLALALKRGLSTWGIQAMIVLQDRVTCRQPRPSPEDKCAVCDPAVR